MRILKQHVSPVEVKESVGGRNIEIRSADLSHELRREVALVKEGFIGGGGE